MSLSSRSESSRVLTKATPSKPGRDSRTVILTYPLFFVVLSTNLAKVRVIDPDEERVTIFVTDSKLFGPIKSRQYCARLSKLCCVAEIRSEIAVSVMPLRSDKGIPRIPSYTEEDTRVDTKSKV